MSLKILTKSIYFFQNRIEIVYIIFNSYNIVLVLIANIKANSFSENTEILSYHLDLCMLFNVTAISHL